MGPTRMDEIARRLAEHKVPMHIVAIAGKDKRAHRKLKSLKVEPPVLLSILSWTEDVAALMQAATILVTKPGGLTIAERDRLVLESRPLVRFILFNARYRGFTFRLGREEAESIALAELVARANTFNPAKCGNKTDPKAKI